MKTLAILLTALFIASTCFASTYVRGYYRSDGTYVAPHYRSSPNSTPYDNYNTKGNYNPYTGKVGTKDPNDYYKNPYPNYNSTPYKQKRR